MAVTLQFLELDLRDGSSLSPHNREELSTYHSVTKCQRVGKKPLAATQPLHSSHTHVSAALVAKSHKTRNFTSN